MRVKCEPYQYNKFQLHISIKIGISEYHLILDRENDDLFSNVFGSKTIDELYKMFHAHLYRPANINFDVDLDELHFLVEHAQHAKSTKDWHMFQTTLRQIQEIIKR